MKVILTHLHGDFDALASLVAASRLYPGSRAVLPDPVQPNVQAFINLYRDLLPLTELKDFDVTPAQAVLVDTARKERLGPFAGLAEKAKKVIIYDHHAPFDTNLKVDLLKNEAVGATTTLLLEELQEKGIGLTEFEATLLALGIYEDTGCLTFELTTARDAAAVAYLWETGISVRLLQEYLRPPLSGEQKLLLEDLIKNNRLYEINQRRVMVSCATVDKYVRGAAVLLQLLDDMEEANLSLMLVQMGDSNLYFAARTRDSDLDLAYLLEPFKVKGHPAAVAANFRNTGCGALSQRILHYLKLNLPPLLKAAEIASSPVFTIKADLPVTEAATMLAARNIKGCPVTEDGKLVGIISGRDLQKALKGNLEHAPVKGFMSRQMISACENDPVTYLRSLMVEHNIGRIPLLDQNGFLKGIVTRSDLLRHIHSMDRSGRFVSGKDVSGKAIFSGMAGQKGAAGNLAELISSEVPQNIADLLGKIGAAAAEEGVSAYLVGGVIRDLLIGYPLTYDLDLVILGDALKFARTMERELGGRLRHFDQFGTATLKLEEGLRLDFVSARKEYYPEPAALPLVQTGNLKNDLFRRDFSINTMACSLMHENYGELYDYFDGRRDLDRRQVRILYKKSFSDDPLRILRAVRFEQRYSFAIEAETLDQLNTAVADQVLQRVSKQRLWAELRQIYAEPDPVLILRRFGELQLLPLLFEGLCPERINWQRLEEIKTLLDWASGRSWDKEPDKELSYLIALTYDLEKGPRFAIMKKLQLSREAAQSLITAINQAPFALSRLRGKEPCPSELAEALKPFSIEGLLLLHTLSKSAREKSYLKLYLDNLQHVRPSIGGDDLKEMGLEPGPLFSEILVKLKEALLDGAVATPQDEIDFVQNYLNRTAPENSGRPAKGCQRKNFRQSNEEN